MNTRLIIADDYFSSLSANAVCIRNIVCELKKHSKILIISEHSQNTIVEDGIEVINLKKAFYSRILLRYAKNRDILSRVIIKVISLIRYFIVFFAYPNVSFLRSRQAYKLAVDSIKKHDIKDVICVYRPFEAIYVALKLKKKYKDKINVVVYHLDLLLEPSNSNSIIRKHKIRKGNDVLIKEFVSLDRVLLPESVRGKYDKYKNVRYVGFPLYIKNYILDSNCFIYDKNTLNVCYIGSLDKHNRNLSYFLKTLDILQRMIEKPIMLHIWGKLSDRETVRMLSSSPYISYHGTVENKHTSYLLKNSDFVLNVGNGITSKMLPSKIFQLFALEKPIINIVRAEDDVSLPYFEKYGAAINVFEIRNNIQDDVNALLAFIENANNLVPNSSGFETSTPEYIVKCLDGGG